MRKHLMTCIVSAALVIMAAYVMTVVADNAPSIVEPETDPFVGWYTKGLLGEAVQITREGDSYRMNNTSGKGSMFRMREQGVLEDKEAVLGTMTLGHLSFTDSPDDQTIVIKAEFCYEHFLLIKQPEAGAQKKNDATAPKGTEQGT